MHGVNFRHFQNIACRCRVHRPNSGLEKSSREVIWRPVGEGIEERVGDVLRRLALQFLLSVEHIHGLLCNGGRSKVLAWEAK